MNSRIRTLTLIMALNIILLINHIFGKISESKILNMKCGGIIFASEYFFVRIFIFSSKYRFSSTFYKNINFLFVKRFFVRFVIMFLHNVKLFSSSFVFQKNNNEKRKFEVFSQIWLIMTFKINDYYTYF